MSNASVPVPISQMQWCGSLSLEDQTAGAEFSTLEKLNAIADRYGVKWPQAYQAIALQVQGQQPHLSRFFYRPMVLEDGEDPYLGDSIERSLNAFLLIEVAPGSSSEIFTIEHRRKLTEESTSGLLPIAMDGRSNLICLSYGPDWSESEPIVVYWDRYESPEESLGAIASSFEAFMKSLFDEEEYEEYEGAEEE